jgi:hypothetical protein
VGIGAPVAVQLQGVDAVDGGERRDAVLLGGLDRLGQPLLEPGAVGDQHVGVPHGGDLLGGRLELVGSGPRRHDHLDRCLVARQVGHHVAQHVGGHDHVGAVARRAGGVVVAAGGQGDGEEWEGEGDGCDWCAAHGRTSSGSEPVGSAELRMDLDLRSGI